MYRAAKVFSWVIFLLCFTFIGLVWTNPIIPKEADGKLSAAVITSVDHSNAYTAINRTTANAAGQSKTAPKPAVMFLMGIGLIGLIAVARAKMFS